ncbi:class I SAM-dependent DNA methyltransferase [Lysinibacillus sp. NPDC093210]|uniref:class I SAM-dependent DNA methyltransferase n=1 Tax=Lysinibacillus sp. NPDC093210 TaxID=3364133 RepID=UPI0038297671
MQQNIYDNPNFFKQYRQLRSLPFNYNQLLEQPAFKALLPDLHDLQLLDIGCGMGEFATFCIENKAKHVTAIDVSKNMLAVAKTLHAHPNIYYCLQSFEKFNAPANSFDCITSSLALHYIEDFDAVIAKVSSMLRKDGVVIFSIEHPIVTARKYMDNWICDEDGDLCHYAIDDYQAEGVREQTWLVEGVIKYHRTLSTILNTLIVHGLTIEKIEEPIPSIEAIQALPKLKKELRKPSFLLVRAKKQ